MSTVHAAQNATAPTVTPTGRDFCDSTCTNNLFAVTVTNPASNQYAITAIILTFPASSGWTMAATACGTDLSTLVAVSANGAECTGTLPPGFTDTLNIGTLEAALTTDNPSETVTFSTSVQDAGSSPANYAGPSFKVYGMEDTLGITVTDTDSGTMVAGGSDTLTGTWNALTGNVGNVLTASVTQPVNGNGVLSVSSGYTDSTGSITTVFTATVAGDYVVTVSCSNPDCTTAGLTAIAFPITVTPATAAEATITLPDSTLSTAPNHYENVYGVDSAGNAGAHTAAAGVTYSLADRYGNAIDFSTLTAGVKITLTALSGGGRFDLGGGVTDASISCPTNFACPALGIAAAIPFDYYQSTIYGTIGKIGITIIATTPATSVSGTSGNIITSSFAAASPIPAVTPVNVGAGSTTTVSASIIAPYAQQGVPVTFYLDVASVPTLVHMDGKFTSSGTNTITLTTSDTGAVSTTYAVDTGAGAVQDFISAVAQPIDGAPTNMLTNSTGSAPVTTVAGTPAEFTISACFLAADTPANCPTAPSNVVGTKVVNGTSVYVDVIIADAYGNLALNPGPNQIEVQLTTSTGLLSVEHAYITLAESDTYTSLGWVAWTMPVSIGTAVTITATGVLSGKSVTASDQVTTVSGLPTFSVTSPAPLNGVIYSPSTTVDFSGQANASIGYPTTDLIQSVGYQIGTGVWQSAVIAPGNQIIWSIPATFSVGLSTIKFNATDSNTNTFVSNTYSVLVETTAPTITFTTTNGAVLNYSQPVSASIVDSEGALNATSVSATYNGTAVASANIVVTGTNKPGTSVTYSVSIKNLPVGMWNIVLSASNYAGLSASAGITATVQVAFAQSVIIISAVKGTLGSFTGISVSATNLWSTSQNLVVFAVFKNGAGQTVDVATGGLTLASGATGSAFAPVTGLPSGSYSVSVFVITTANNPVSSSTSIAVTF